MHSIGAALLGAAFVVLAWAGPGRAQDVTLTSRDGAIRIEGTLLGYDGEFYRVATRFGELTLDGTAVSCDGPGCPDLAAFVATVRISGAAEIGQVLLPALIEAHANRSGLGVRRAVTSDTEFAYDLTDPASDLPILRLRFHLTSSAEGFADLIADEADLALSLRACTC
jgi:phosphate transport system substrate-binding protein